MLFFLSSGLSSQSLQNSRDRSFGNRILVEALGGYILVNMETNLKEVFYY